MLIIVSCSKEIPFNQSVERHGLVYEVNSEKPFSGTLISNFENTQVHFKLRYKNGVLDGLQETYYSSGQIESRENYQTGIYDGIQETYYYNGQIKSKNNYLNGVLEGVQEIYFEDGRLERKENRHKGKLDGIFESYSKNNYLLIAKGHFNNGLKEGYWLEKVQTFESLEYFGGGPYQLRGTYKNGIKEGEWELHDDERLKAKMNFKKGILNGKAKRYLIGRLYQEGNFKDGKEIGIHFIYNSSTSYFAKEFLPNEHTLSKLFYYGNSGPSEVNCYNRFGNSASMSKCVSTTPMDQFLIKQ